MSIPWLNAAPMTRPFLAQIKIARHPQVAKGIIFCTTGSAT
jgi:hypothetical protein